jgi:hypothetical protein
MEIKMAEIKESLEYAYAEIADLKKENEDSKENQAQARESTKILERDNKTLHDKIIDIQLDQCATMYFNSLTCLNWKRKKTTEMIHELLESKIGM